MTKVHEPVSASEQKQLQQLPSAGSLDTKSKSTLQVKKKNSYSQQKMHGDYKDTKSLAQNLVNQDSTDSMPCTSESAVQLDKSQTVLMKPPGSQAAQKSIPVSAESKKNESQHSSIALNTLASQENSVISSPKNKMESLMPTL